MRKAAGASNPFQSIAGLGLIALSGRATTWPIKPIGQFIFIASHCPPTETHLNKTYLMFDTDFKIETLKKMVESKRPKKSIAIVPIIDPDPWSWMRCIWSEFLWRTLTVKFQKGAFDGLTATDMSEGATTLVNSGGAASPMKEKEPKSQHLLFRAGLCLFLSVFYIWERSFVAHHCCLH